MKIRAAFICLLVSLFFFAAPAQTSPSKRFTFKIFVSADKDPELRSAIESYLSREIRSLGDAEVVNKSADWWLNVSVIKVSSKSNDFLGYAIKYVLTRVVSCGGKLYWDYKDGGIYTAPRDGVRSIIETLITDIDRLVLTDERTLAPR